MERIRQAMERARESDRFPAAPPADLADPAPPSSGPAASHRDGADQPRASQCQQLDKTQLESARIISHDTSDPRANAFHMLRTQILQSMDQARRRFLAATSPTAGCGTTTTAINLAISMGRQSDRSVILVDLNLQRPEIANRLGLKCEHDLLSVIDGRASLKDAVIETQAGNSRMLVLPSKAAASASSEVLASRRMGAVLQDIKTSYPSSIVIFDLPPILPSDDAISVLPGMDCVLLVTAGSATTFSELRACHLHLRGSNVVRIVVNKIVNRRDRQYG